MCHFKKLILNVHIALVCTIIWTSPAKGIPDNEWVAPELRSKNVFSKLGISESTKVFYKTQLNYAQSASESLSNDLLGLKASMALAQSYLLENNTRSAVYYCRKAERFLNKKLPAKVRGYGYASIASIYFVIESDIDALNNYKYALQAYPELSESSGINSRIRLLSRYTSHGDSKETMLRKEVKSELKNSASYEAMNESDQKNVAILLNGLKRKSLKVYSERQIAEKLLSVYENYQKSYSEIARLPQVKMYAEKEKLTFIQLTKLTKRKFRRTGSQIEHIRPSKRRLDRVDSKRLNKMHFEALADLKKLCTEKSISNITDRMGFNYDPKEEHCSPGSKYNYKYSMIQDNTRVIRDEIKDNHGEWYIK